MMPTECAASLRAPARTVTDGVHVDPLEAPGEAPVRKSIARGIYVDDATAVDARARTCCKA